MNDSLVFRQFHTRNSHRSDTFFASDEPHRFIGGGFNTHPLRGNAQRLGDVLLHLSDVRRDLGLLREEGRINVDNAPARARDLSRRFAEKYMARSAFPTGIGVGKKVSDVCLSDCAEDGVRDRMKESVGVGMSVETSRVRNLHAAEDQLPTLDELVNIIANSDALHGGSIGS